MHLRPYEIFYYFISSFGEVNGSGIMKATYFGLSHVRLRGINKSNYLRFFQLFQKISVLHMTNLFRKKVSERTVQV